jgi:predicted double-glycine peptidase
LRALALLFIAVWTNTPAEPLRSLLEIRHHGVVIQQWDTSCGAAALATVLTFDFGDRVAEKSVARGMLRSTDPVRVRVRGGFSLLDMKRYAESRGYKAAGYRNLSLEELAAMRSPIVVISEYGDPHFVVVRSVGEGRVHLADPAFGNRSMSIGQFREAWREGIGFIVSRAQ